MRASIWTDDPHAPSTSSSQSRFPSQSSLSHSNSSLSDSNVLRLLSRREVCPQTKRLSKRRWKEASKQHHGSWGSTFESEQDAKRGLVSWVEAESLQHLSAKYCTLLPPPRSTIAAAFSPDGKTLASTHGDHTVKIIDCQTGRCLRVLRGHRRTPWVVRFHPLNPAILASGSLDHEVRLWDANTAECIGSRDFYRPIASIGFHAHGEFLAVASGHKLYIWHYNRRGEMSSPRIVLRTRRSLRAVHFHPHAAPFLLTAEVNDLDPSESSMTLATSPGYLSYPPPAVYMANAHFNGRPSLPDEPPLMTLSFLLWPSFARDYERISLQHTDGNGGASHTQETVDSSSSVRVLTFSTLSGQYELVLSPIEPNSSSPIPEDTGPDSMMNEINYAVPETVVAAVDTVEVQPEERRNYLCPLGDPTYWELPFLHTSRSLNGSAHENFAASGETENLLTSSLMSTTAGQSRVTLRSGSGHQSSRSRIMSATGSGEGTAFINIPHSESGTQPFASRFPAEYGLSLASATAAELPCTVKLRIWPHDIKDPCANLEGERCCLTIPHAVLCSEMGAHFSPCGRYLAACVACVLPPLEADPGLQGQVQHDVSGAGTSPTRHPISAHQVMYELRIYSLEEATFGLVLASRAIRAAHCLTSIQVGRLSVVCYLGRGPGFRVGGWLFSPFQFSPTSEHLLLAYGRRHRSLLRSVVIDGGTTVPIYTILEIYRVSDMELVRVLPSAEDEVNVACFHPSVGGGLVYGTKEGKLRILQCDGSYGTNPDVSSFLNETMVEVDECPHVCFRMLRKSESLPTYEICDSCLR